MEMLMVVVVAVVVVVVVVDMNMDMVPEKVVAMEWERKEARKGARKEERKEAILINMDTIRERKEAIRGKATLVKKVAMERRAARNTVDSWSTICTWTRTQ